MAQHWLILGDWGFPDTGRNWRCDPDERERLPATVQLAGTPAGTLSFVSRDDFHADALLANSPRWSRLLGLSKRLSAGSGTRAELEEARALLPSAAAAGDPSSPAPDSPPDNEMERLLGRRRPPVATQETPAASWVDQLAREAARDHVVSGPSDEAARIAAGLGDEVARELAATLADPAFRRLESAWRGLDQLLRRLPAGEEVSIVAMQADRDGLVAALTAHRDNGERSPLVDGIFGQPSRVGRQRAWELILSLETFDNRAEDLAFLLLMAGLAARADARLMAAAAAGVWESAAAGEVPPLAAALRTRSEGSRVTLCCPPLLHRAPYGPRTNPVEAFPFDETIPRGTAAGGWMSPVWMVAAALAGSGCRLGPDGPWEIDSLPMTALGEGFRSTRCAWTDTESENLVRAGLLPIRGIPGTSRIRIGAWQPPV